MSRIWTRGKAVVSGVLQYVSPSQMAKANPNVYAGCLRAWHYDKVLGKKQPQTPAQKRGEELHSEVEHYLLTGQNTLSRTVLAGKHFIPKPDNVLVEHPVDDGTLEIAGLPVVGFIDVVNASETFIDSEGELHAEPDTVEIIDWKFGNIDYAKSGLEISKSTPMIVYGKWAARRFQTRKLRLSHVNFSTIRAQAVKNTYLQFAEENLDPWNKLTPVVRTMIDAAGESESKKIEANLKSCSAYGTGCPHKSYCPGGSEKTLVDLLGSVAARKILEKKERDMGLLDIPALQNFPEQVAEAKATLISSLAPAVDPAVVQAVTAINAAGRGIPTLTGEAARAWSSAVGIPLTDHIAGAGLIAGAQIATVDQILQVAKELAAMDAAPPALLPPDAPASDPAKASAPPVEAAPVAVAEEKPKKRGRKKRVEPEATAPVSSELAAGVPSQVMVADPVGLTLYVNCIPSYPCPSLASWVDARAADLVSEYGVADIRCAPNDSPLGFGKWKGALAALVRETPIDDGPYYLDTYGSEILEVAADALRSQAAVYVRGLR